MKRAVCFFLLTPLILPAAFARQAEKVAINNSLIAFTIPEKDLLPESVAFDPVERAFYIGSTRKGKVVKVDRGGRASDFIPARRDGLWMVIGMKVDPRRRFLWVNSSAGSNLVGHKRGDPGPAGVFKFDLETGRLIKKYVLDSPGEVHFFNDLALNKRGDVFVTHMFKDAAVYKIAAGADSLELFARPEGLTYPNGITFSEDGRLLFVAHGAGVSAFNVEDKSHRLLASPPGASLKEIDGLYFHKDSLIAIHPDLNLVRRYYLDADMKSVVRAETIEAHHPMFNNPTTGVIAGDTFYYIANAQFGSFNKDGSLYPMERLFEVVVLKAKL